MLQVTYEIRNSDWVRRTPRVATTTSNSAPWRSIWMRPGTMGPSGQVRREVRPFYWDQNTKTYSGVLTTVSNPSKVKTDGTGSPAICGRGNFTDLPGYVARVDGLYPVRLGLQVRLEHGLLTSRRSPI